MEHKRRVRIGPFPEEPSQAAGGHFDRKGGATHG